ncbi:hypothetical protein BDA99DRAFT_559531 [Phascolomyces articulosus]|uniref:Uncharacterized protein n=1 Tax=Phascolomyces articulosus TaxID=60185 RepID=A0AAD5PEM7_9FUNG|nr:hypothetical protein BDA99DRAFT_559531 [Phascolomyces articulosus]
MNMYSKQYEFTNIADMMLGNTMGRPEHHPMFIDADTGESVTLYRFRLLIHHLHAGLKRFGLQRGDTVCIYTPNNIYMAPIYFGVMSAGMAISPANSSYVAHELQHQLNVGEAKMLIAHPSTLDRALEAAAAIGLPRSSVFSIVRDPQQRVPCWLETLIDFTQPSLPPIRLTHEESVNTVAYLCFSGGTTGRNPSIKKMILGALPLYHFGGIHRAFTLGIPSGSTTVIMEKYTVKGACEAIQRFKVTDFQTAPPIIIQFLNNPIVNSYDLSSLRALNVGAAPIAANHVTQFEKKFQGATLLNTYGMSEASPGITYQQPEWARPDTIGRIAPFMKYKIINPKDGNEVKLGETGELCLKGPNVMLGYKGNPEATAEAIDTEGWLHSGDICKEDKDGNIFLVDRIKELIKYKGFQVAPADLESVIFDCPYVADNVVIGIHDKQQDTEIPLAFVVLDPKVVTLNEQKDIQLKIQAWVNERVANHKRLRGGVVVIDKIPRNAAGKLLRREAKEIYNKQQQQRSSKL